jgi:hypothetical protein
VVFFFGIKRIPIKLKFHDSTTSMEGKYVAI